MAELRPLIQCHHHILQWQELLYLGDERLPAGQAEQPGGHQLVGLHIHQVEVDEFAPSPPWPHTDVQVLNAIGREEEGTARIYLWNNTWRYSHPQRLITALESPAWSINYTQLLLKTCTPILPLLNPIPPSPRNTLGLIHAGRRKATQEHPGPPQPMDFTTQALPGEPLPFLYRTAMEFFCLLLFTFPITNERILKKLRVFRQSH